MFSKTKQVKLHNNKFATTEQTTDFLAQQVYTTANQAEDLLQPLSSKFCSMLVIVPASTTQLTSTHLI